MTDDYTNVLVQVLAFTSIPFVVYLIKKKSVKGFFNYIGLKRSNPKANLYGALLMFLFAGPILVIALNNSEFLTTLKTPPSLTGKFSELGFSFSSLVLLILMAVFKTALAEEILFRGFIAKRLIAITNFPIGNLIHALIFGVVHWLLFLQLTESVLFLTVIFVFPTIGAYLKVYINEKMADGSIIPGWIAHGLSNLFSYSVIGFVL